MLTAANPADYRRGKTTDFQLKVADVVEIIDKHARPKGVEVLVTRAGEPEPIKLFIPVESWDAIRPSTWSFTKLTFGTKFSYQSDQIGLTIN